MLKLPVFIVALALMPACSADPDPAATTKTAEGVTKTPALSGKTLQRTFSIEGMTCQGCVSTVSRIFKGVPGVSEVRVTLDPGRAEITCDQNVSATQLMAALHNAENGGIKLEYHAKELQ